MPQAIAYAVPYLITGAASVAGLVAGTLIIGGMASYQRRKQRRAAIDAWNSNLQDRLVTAPSTDGRRSRVYGRVRNVDELVYRQTHGTNSEFYTLVFSLAAHEVDAIETVYFDNTPLTLDGNGYVLTAPWNDAKPVNASEPITITGGSGSMTLAQTPIAGTASVTIQTGAGDTIASYSATPTVTGASLTVSGLGADGTGQVHYQYSQQDPKARVLAFTGGAGQDLYATLSGIVGTDQLLPTDRFANDATLIVTLKYSQDVFPSGAPAVSALMRGARVFDPRTGVTAWTENPALIGRDWALYAYGGGAASSEIIEPAFTAAANACDVSTAFVTPSGTEVRPLYQCGIACPLDADPEATLAEIVESMAGQHTWHGGRLSVRAGVWRAPVTTITEDWVSDRGDVEIVAQTATADLVNVMRPKIADAAQNYVPAPTAQVRLTAAIAADGRELPREASFGGVTRAVHAQHISGVLMRELREGLTITLPLKMIGLVLEPFDVVQMNLPRYGFVGTYAEVVAWSFSLDSGPRVTFRETSPGIFDPDTSFDTLSVAQNTLLPRPEVVEQITGVTVTSGTTPEVDRSILVRTTVSWNAVTSQAVRQSGWIEVQYTPAGSAMPSGDWPAAAPVPGTATSATIAGLIAGVHYVFRVRAVSTLGVRGPWSEPTTDQTAAAPKATRITLNEHDFAGANFGGVGVASAHVFTLTPEYDCTIEFTATLKANVLTTTNSDFAWWTFEDPGPPTSNIVATFDTDNAVKTTYTAVGSIDALAGITYNVRLNIRRYVSSPNAFYLSKLRTAEIYR